MHRVGNVTSAALVAVSTIPAFGFSCDRQVEFKTIGFDEVADVATVSAGTNAVRTHCSLDIDVPGHTRIRGNVSWRTEPSADARGLQGSIQVVGSDFGTLEADVEQPYAQPGGLWTSGFGINIAPETCSVPCSKTIEVTVIVAAHPSLGAADIEAGVFVSVQAEVQTTANVPDGTVVLVCDPVEHLTLPVP